LTARSRPAVEFSAMAHVVTYTYSFDDYLALIRARRAMGLFGRYATVIRYILFVVTFLLVLAALTDWNATSLNDLANPETALIIVGGMIAIAAFITLVDLFFDRVLYRLVFRRFALANTELTVTLDEGGIAWKGRGISANTAWPMVKRIYVGSDRLFVFFSKIEALVLPARSLPSEAAFRDLVDYVRRRIGENDAVAATAGARA
jgi:hypothetical protein